MAETDVMLVAIQMDADGAIKDTEVLDRKFTSLGSTFQKGQKRAEGAEKAQKKLTKSIKEGGNATTKANVQTIANLALMEAATSGLNQLISAQYKRIDADLASGKINAEEAELKRKQIKQQEKYTGILETGIAIARLATVAQMLYAAATQVTTAGVKANTIAVLTLNGALYANPLLWIVVAVIALVAVLLILESKFGLVTKGVEAANQQFENLLNWANGVRDSIVGLGEDIEDFVEEKMKKLDFLGDMMG